MSTLTGQSISASYLGLIHLSTNTQIANNTNTQLQDGSGNNLGVYVNTNGTLTATNFSGSLIGTASNATFAVTARTASYATVATSASSANYATLAGFVTTASYSISSSFLQGTASFADSANFASSAGNANTAISASFATSASYARNAQIFPYAGIADISGSLNVSGSITQIKNFNSAPFYSDAIINGVGVGVGRWSASLAFTAASASSNTALGYQAMVSNSHAWNNTAIGSQALYSIFPDPITNLSPEGADGFNNTAVGFKAGYSQRVFGYGTYIGAFAGAGDQGEGNTAVGYNSLTGKDQLNAGGWYNVAVGWHALLNLSASLPYIDTTPDPRYGLRNIAVGYDAGAGIVSGNDNVAIGYRTIYGFDPEGTGTALGKSYNIAVGSRALNSLQYGGNNIMIGYYNATIPGGYEAPNLVSGSYNVVIGSDIKKYFFTGSGNTIIGSGISLENYLTGSPAFGYDQNTRMDNHIIIANGNGSIKAVNDGSSWRLFDVVSGSFSGSFIGTFNGNATSATSASYANNAQTAFSATSASYALTASYATGGDFVALGTNNTFTGTQTYNNTASYNNTTIYTADTVYSSSVSAKVNELTQSLSHNIDLSTGNLFTLTLQTGSNSVTVSNVKRGVSGIIQLQQPSSGYGSVSFSSTFDFPSGSAFTGSAVSNALDIVSFVSFDGSSLKTIIGGYNFI